MAAVSAVGALQNTQEIPDNESKEPACVNEPLWKPVVNMTDKLPLPTCPLLQITEDSESHSLA